MPSVAVSCPQCGAKLKAPENMVGKKAKCKKCHSSFRIPASSTSRPPSASEDLRPTQTPGPIIDDFGDVPMAEPVLEDEIALTPAPPTPAVPAKDLSSLPSADPFDFGKPTKDTNATKPTKPSKTITPPPAKTPAPTPPAPPAPVKPTPAVAAIQPEVLSLDDPPEPLPIDDPLPIEPVFASRSDPFAFTAEPSPKAEKPTKTTKRDEEKHDAAAAVEPKAKKKSKNDEDPVHQAKKKSKRDEEPLPDDQEKPRYRRPEKGKLGPTILITAIVGVFALGLGAAAIMMFVKNNKKEPEQAKAEKKEEPATSSTVPAAPAGDAQPEPTEKKFDPKPMGNVPPSPGTGRAGPDGSRFKTFTLGTLPAKLQQADPARESTVLDAPFKTIRRVFPPTDPKTADTHVLIQTAPGSDGKAEKLALDAYSPSSKKRVPMSRIEYDGDGLSIPIADFTTSPAGEYFLAATGGKLHVWAVNTKNKMVDGINPYADKPEHAKAGLAAAFFAADPNQVVLVSTAGGILLYDLNTRKAVSDFIPPKGLPGSVSQGVSIAKANGGESVVVAVAEVLYQVRTKPGLEVVRKHEVGVNVSRSLGLAASGTPGRLLYVFETNTNGTKEQAILCLPLGTDPPVLYQWPSSAGEPKGTLWANEEFGGLVGERGVIWLEDQDKKILPLLFTQPSAEAMYFGNERFFWYAIPQPKDATKSVLTALALPFDDLDNYEKSSSARRPLRAVQIDGDGLKK